MSRNEENVEKVHQAVLADCHWANDEISEITGVSWSSCQRILVGDLMVSSSGSIVGIAASSHRGSTVKGTKVSNLYEYFK